jgi:hypothetical protein
VEVARYLGIYVDDKLSWSHHVNAVCNKISKLSYVFRVLGKYIKNTQICELYYAFVYPHIYYGIEIYGNCNRTIIHQLQVAQNNLLRILLHKNRRSSATEMHNQLNLLKVIDVHEVAVLTFVYKQRHNLLPEVFTNYFRIVSERATRSRKNNDLHIEYARTTGRMKAIKISGAKMWNLLPPDIKDAQNIYQFKKMVKCYKKC